MHFNSRGARACLYADAEGKDCSSPDLRVSRMEEPAQQYQSIPGDLCQASRPCHAATNCHALPWSSNNHMWQPTSEEGTVKLSAPSCGRSSRTCSAPPGTGYPQTSWNVTVCCVLTVIDLVQIKETKVPAPDLRKELRLVLHKPPQAEAEPLHQQRGAGCVAHALHCLSGGTPRLHCSVG